MCQNAIFLKQIQKDNTKGDVEGRENSPDPALLTCQNSH